MRELFVVIDLHLIPLKELGVKKLKINDLRLLGVDSKFYYSIFI